MKKLLCIVSGMNAGGAETFLMKVFRHLDKSKYMMDFAVNIDSKGFYDDEIINSGGKILRFPAKSASLVRYIFGLKKIVKEGQYDAVLRISSNAMGFLDLAIAKLAGAKVCVARSSNSSDGNHISAKISHWLGKILLKCFVDVKIAPSSEAAKYTFGKNDYERGLVHILPNGLDLDYFRYTENGRIKVRKEFGIASTQKILGHVGRFSKQKNHSFLLGVFFEFHRLHPDSVLLLVGEGELKDDIQKKISEKGIENSVIFAGIRSDMPSIYSAMDVFVFPSLYEGMPNAVIEAQACGLPCIVSDTVTQEANVTNSVEYESLKNIDDWVKKINRCTNKHRIDLTYNLKKAGYDIDDVVKKLYRIM